MTTNPPAQQRAAVAAPAPAKPPCNIHSTAIVADKAVFTGTHQIEIGEHCVIHPYAKLRSEGGPVTLGPYCTVAEAAELGGSLDEELEVTIGSHVSIDGGAEVRAARVGDNTDIGIKAVIGAGSVLGKHCKIASKCVVQPNEVIEDYTVVYGANLKRKDTTTESNATYRDAQIKGQEQHVEALQRVIPNAAVKFSS